GFRGGDTAAADGLRRIVIRPLSPFLRYLSSINSRTAARTGLVLTWYLLERASNVSPSERICPERMFAMRSCLMNEAMDIGLSVVDIVDNVKYIVDSVKKIPRLRVSATKGGIGTKDRAFGQTRPSRRSFRATGALVAVMVAISSGPAAAQQPLLWGSL